MTTSAARRLESLRRFDPPAHPSDRSRLRALILCVAALVVFAVVGVLSYGPSHLAEPADLWWSDLMLDARTDAGVVLAWIPAVIGGPIAMLVIGILLVGAFLFLGWRRVAATVAGAMIASVVLAAPLAAVVARSRPESSLAETVPTSFPSGHTAMAATVAVILGLVFRRWVVWVLGFLWVVVMAWSRTYLEAHWLTDVMAGAMLGIVAGSLIWLVSDSVRRRRVPRRDQQGTPAVPSP